MTSRIAVPLLLALAALAPTAELPLGLVETVETVHGQNRASLRFDPRAAATLQPGTMVALYGPGSIEKHPLTKEVLITRPALVGKAQLIAVGDGLWRSRVLWLAPGANIAKGMDAVPLPGEAAPNSLPIAGTVTPQHTPQGTVLELSLPVRDPDGDPLSVAWTLEGPAGWSGTLLESATTRTSTRWLAPLHAGPVTAVATVADSLGQSITLRLPLTTTDAEDPRERTPGSWYALGNLREPALSHLARAEDGTWWGSSLPVGMTGTAGLIRLRPGMNGSEALTIKPEEIPRKPVGLALRGDELHVLDAGRGLVAVYGSDGAQHRTYGSFEKAIDLALAEDGTAYVADAADRGIHVLEADGRYRCRLGRGTGEDALQAIAAVTVAADGTVLALDPLRPALVRFDRFGHRLDNWACPGTPKDLAVDVVVHPQRGALVLLASGKVVPVTAAGLGEPLVDPAATAGLTAEHAGLGLVIDRSGTLYALLQGGLTLRWNADLSPAGVRGASLRTGDAWAADGQGRTFALDKSSGTVAVFDAEQWQTARLATGVRKAVALAVSPRGRYLAVIDAKSTNVIRLDLTTPTRPGITLGQEGTYDGQFKTPVALAFDDQDRLYVLDQDLYRVAIFGADAAFLFNAGSKNVLKDPELVAVNADGSQLFVYDSDAYEIKRFSLDHSARRDTAPIIGGGKGSGPGQLRSVVGLACDRRGLLHVLDDRRKDLQVLDFRGQACQPLTSLAMADLDLTDLVSLAIHPDGPMIIAGAGRIVGWRW